MTNEEAIKLVDDRMCFGRGKWSEHHRPVIDVYWQAGKMAIKALEAEPHWTPCSEQPPEEDVDVLCQTFSGARLVASYGILNPWDTEKGWITAEFNRLSKEMIKAWMPLPEPFKGVTE